MFQLQSGQGKKQSARWSASVGLHCNTQSCIVVILLLVVLNFGVNTNCEGYLHLEGRNGAPMNRSSVLGCAQFLFKDREGMEPSPNLTFLYPESSHGSFETSLEFLVMLGVQNYFPPIMIVLGSVGNLTSFFTLLRPTFKRHSVGLYLSTFVLLNVVYLYAGCGLEWLSHITGLPNVSHLADWTCRIWKFLFTVTRHSLDWLLVPMVADRLIATCYALVRYRGSCCKPFVARVVVIGVFVGLVAVGIHAMWIYGLTDANECAIDQPGVDAASIAWPWFSAVALSYLPDVILLVLTPLLIVVFVRRISPPADVTGSVNWNEEAIQSSFTLCCICTTAGFLLCTIPPNILNIFLYANPPDLVTLYFSFAACSLITCVQSSVTFLWYFLCISKLRYELRTMLGEACKHHKQHHKSTEQYTGTDMVQMDEDKMEEDKAI